MLTTPCPPIEMTDDDRVLLHAIGMAGDAVREGDVAYLLSRWPFATPMDWARVEALEAAGMLQRTDDGWFVPYAVEVEVAATLPKALDVPLKGFVGEMLCRGADSLERFQLGFRRMLAGGREHALVAVCRVWAAQPAGRKGPRGTRFVDTLSSKKLSPALRAELADAVPELETPSAWRAPLRTLREKLAWPEGLTPAAATAAAIALFLLDLVGRAGADLDTIARR